MQVDHTRSRLLQRYWKGRVPQKARQSGPCYVYDKDGHLKEVIQPRLTEEPFERRFPSRLLKVNVKGHKIA